MLATTARSGEGVEALVAALDDHRRATEASGELSRRRQRRAREEIEAVAVAVLRRRWAAVSSHAELDELAASVAAGRSDPYTAADRLVAGVTHDEGSEPAP